MTNSNNRTMGGGGNSEGNASRQQLLTGSAERQPFGKQRRKNKGKKIPNKSASPTNSVSSSQSDSNNYLSGRSHQQSFINFSPRGSHQQYNYSNGINIQVHRSSPGGFSAASSPAAASSPPNASSLFAGSKCFDAPPPNALPRPPLHWFSCAVASSQQSSDDDLSHNLRMLLNVRATVEQDLLLSSPICIMNSSTAVTF
ncbi:proline-rich nuclear receptor coactivator 2 [Bradysia coprophila]|uniref:proline-rich nuclear receptor coactivator 2 n=1 Tax=Bradysia coprophila TaxID=38358 RepID=UPI00187DC342|nr:proline-rich nuclear receptor coactivator 2 [Bradysia coprophila]